MKPYNLLFAFLLLFHHALFADEITVVTECDNPCKIRESDGLPDSLPTTIILELFKLTNDIPNIQVLPWARAYNMALDNKNILIYSISKTPKREPLFNWVGDILIERYYVWELNDNKLTSAASEHFYKGKSFATYRESNEFDYLNQLEDITTYSVVYPNQRLHMLLANRVDYLVESEQTLKETCLSLNIDCSRFSKVIEVKELNTPLSIGINKDSDPEIVEKYQKAFSSLSSSGTLSHIINKWKL